MTRQRSKNAGKLQQPTVNSGESPGRERENIDQPVDEIDYFDPHALFNEDGNLKAIRQIEPDKTKATTATAFANIYAAESQQCHRSPSRKTRISDLLRALELIDRHLKASSFAATLEDNNEFRTFIHEKLDLTKATDKEIENLATLAATRGGGSGDQ